MMTEQLGNIASFLKEPFADSPAEVRNGYVIASALVLIAEALMEINAAVNDDGIKTR